MGLAIISAIGLIALAEPPISNPEAHAETAKVVNVEPVRQEAIPAKPETTPVETTEITQPVVLDNETIAWNFFISNGFTREQTAGILGNFQQEHNFNTSDVPGGLGIAQWLGNRRANLMARENYLDINVQLQFVLDELNTGESASKTALLSTSSVEAATERFMTKYERCNPYYCHLNQRINYAYAILERH